MRTAVLFLLAAGCGFHSVGNGDGGNDNGDMSVSGDTPDLFGVPPGSDLSSVMSGACAAPMLLVGVENLMNTSATGGGRVARVSLAGGNAQQCSTLSGQGLIGNQPMAVAAFDGLIGAATFDGLYVVDPATDTVKWSKPSPDSADGWGPFDAFAVEGTTGTPYVAAAWGPDFGISGAGIRWLEIYDADGNAAPGAPFCIQQASCTDLGLSLGIYSMAAAPATPSHFFALDGSNDVAAVDVNPWTTPPTKMTHVGTYSESLASIYAAKVGSDQHFAWFDNNMSGGAIQWSVDNGSATPSLNGPFKCTSSCATILHVVPDPSQTNGFFALCDSAMVNTRTVVRTDAAGSCAVVLDGTQFGTESRLSRLAIAP